MMTNLLPPSPDPIWRRICFDCCQPFVTASEGVLHQHSTSSYSYYKIFPFATNHASVTTGFFFEGAARVRVRTIKNMASKIYHKWFWRRADRTGSLCIILFTDTLDVMDQFNEVPRDMHGNMTELARRPIYQLKMLCGTVAGTYLMKRWSAVGIKYRPQTGRSLMPNLRRFFDRYSLLSEDYRPLQTTSRISLNDVFLPSTHEITPEIIINLRT